jgi:hypothetical protein
VRPAEGAKVPARQFVHAELAGTPAAEPGLHSEQVVILVAPMAAENVPDIQFEHVEAPKTELYVPDAQF